MSNIYYSESKSQLLFRYDKTFKDSPWAKWHTLPNKSF